MPAANTLSEALDNLYTTTWHQMKDSAVDNIFDGTPFWFWMRDNGRLKTVSGGRFLTEALRYAKSDKVTWIKKGSTVALNDLEFLTIAIFQWRYLVDSIVRFGVDDQQNRGKFQIINLMTAKLENSQDSLVDVLETSLFAAAGTDEMNGLQDLVADDPTTGVLGTIDPAVYTWWQNKVKDMAGLSFATNGVNQMRTLYNTVSNNLRMDRPDIIITGQTVYEYYEDEVEEQKRIINQKLGDASFENIQFKGLPVVWSPSCGTRLYFLNTRFLMFEYDPAMLFEMTEWKAIPDQVNDRAAQIVTACNFVTSRRRAQGVMFNIDTE